MRPAIQFSGRVTALILAVLWLCQTPLLAGIYKWKDDQGKIHFTDDKSNIPLKHRGQFEKFRGVTEPKPKEEEPHAGQEPPPGGEQGELKSGQEPQTASQPPPPKEEAKSQPQYTEEELAQLKESHIFLVKTRDRQVGLLNRGFTRSIGEDYIRIAPNLFKLKRKMARKIRKTTVPSLEEAWTYLKKSARKDRAEKMDEKGFEERVARLKKRLEKSTPLLNEIIDQIKTDLGMELVPHPTLATAAKDKSNKRSAR